MTIFFRHALALLLLPAIFISPGCSDNHKPAAAPAEVPVIQLSEIDTTISRSYVADIQSVQNVEIRARLQGYLQQIFVDEGQAVHKGQLLFQIDPTEFRIALQKADADVSSAQADARMADVELKRVTILVGKRVVTPSDADLALAKLSAAKAAVARQQLATHDNELNALLGGYPKRVERDSALVALPLPASLVRGVPAATLLNRPDIAEAGLQLAATKAELSAARKAFFPSLTLTAYGGLNSFR